MKIGIHGSLPCELREFAIKNTAFSDTKASLICYIEPTMISSADFEAHPAFMRLFMNIRYDVRHRLIIAERNLRNGEKVYSATGFVNPVDSILCFDREKVLVYPEASVFDNAMKIKECHTSVPDGCIFIRTDLLFYPREQKNLKLFICSASTEEELYNTAAKIRNNALPGSISGFLPASAEVRLAEKILPQILYDNADTAEQTSAKKKNLLKINELWNYDVSGDYPIVTAEIKTHLADARISSYSGCHELLKRSGIEFDLVFIFSENSTKTKLIQDYIIHEIRSASASDSIGMRGGIHLVNLFERDEMIRTLVFASASHTAPTDMVFMEKPYSKYSPMKISPVGHKQSLSASFLFKEKSVVIDKMPKLPWCHILANETFGTLISSASLGYTYAVNSRENKLTPWFNDSRTDNSGEMLIIKYKEKCYNLIAESQVEFSADNAVYSGQCDDFSSRVSVSVADKGMCKKISVEIDWHGGNDICKIAYYTEPLLSSDNTHARYVTAEKSGNYLTFSNSRNYSVKGYMALSCDKPFSSMTNRADFLSGRWNQLSSGGKPCGAIIVGRSVSFGKKIKLNFYMSFGATEQAAKSIIKRYIPQKNFSENKISINTPDKNINNMFNTWLTQQIIKGRIFAKTGFYQNSGATGFRDQLQDACAAVLIRPEILRYQILRACRVQFPEGDVLHWWHRLPENNFRGVRTRCSDDLLWLPYALCEYTEKTNDLSLLTINVHYCSADALSDDEQEKYMNVSESELNESVSEHCRRALEKAFGFGNNGLCLIGLCDWNDGYNKLGEKGIGESVWLSEFLCVVLDKYSTLCRKNGDIKQADMYDEKRKELTENIEKACWDGNWYIRAISDEGRKIGSDENDECKIDSLAQSFAVLARLSEERRNTAVKSAFDILVDRQSETAALFTPAFSEKSSDVGYIAAYPKGIRENGGQYTHGAVWLAIALFEAGMNSEAYEVMKCINPAEKYENNLIAERYKTEPYYVCADIYCNPECVGRGGWSVYTGAAGWYYRAIFEWLLGIKINADRISFLPKIPLEWTGFSADIIYKKTAVSLSVERGNDCSLYDNGKKVENILLDGEEHTVKLIINQ